MDKTINKKVQYIDYDLEELNKRFIGDFLFFGMFVNIRSLYKNNELVKEVIENISKPFRYLMFAETWFKKEKAYPKLDDYKIVNTDRLNGKGGGELQYIIKIKMLKNYLT